MTGPWSSSPGLPAWGRLRWRWRWRGTPGDRGRQRGLAPGLSRHGRGDRQADPEVRARSAHHLIDVVDPDDRYQRRPVPRGRRGGDRVDPRAADPCPSSSAVPGSTSAPSCAGSTRRRPPIPRSGASSPSWRAAEGRAALHARLQVAAPAAGAARCTRTTMFGSCARSSWRAPVPARSTKNAGGRRSNAYDVTLLRPHHGPRGAGPASARSRAAAIVEAGLRVEVERLLARGYDASLPAMQRIGYREFARVVRGALDAGRGASTHAARHGALRQAAVDVVRARAGHRVDRRGAGGRRRGRGRRSLRRWHEEVYSDEASRDQYAGARGSAR